MAAAKDDIWIRISTEARDGVDAPDLCCCQGHLDSLRSEPQSVTISVSDACAATGTRPIWATRTVNWGYGNLWTRTMAVDPDTLRVCVDV